MTNPVKPPRILTMTQRRALGELVAVGGTVQHRAIDGATEMAGASLQMLCLVGAVTTDGAVTCITNYGRAQALPPEGSRHEHR